VGRRRGGTAWPFIGKGRRREERVAHGRNQTAHPDAAASLHHGRPNRHAVEMITTTLGHEPRAGAASAANDSPAFPLVLPVTGYKGALGNNRDNSRRRR